MTRNDDHVWSEISYFVVVDQVKPYPVRPRGDSSHGQDNLRWIFKTSSQCRYNNWILDFYVRNNVDKKP